MREMHPIDEQFKALYDAEATFRLEQKRRKRSFFPVHVIVAGRRGRIGIGLVPLERYHHEHTAGICGHSGTSERDHY